jgi:hypothetical protein
MSPLRGLVLAMVAALPVSAQPVRVGTFDKPSIVVAYTRSQLKADTVMKPKLAERQRAMEANDTRKVQELNAWGSAQQEYTHEQLVGERPITNILAALAPGFPEIAKKAGVTLIAVDVPYAGPAVETVDVTGAILDWLKSDEATRRIIRDLSQHIPQRPGAP